MAFNIIFEIFEKGQIYYEFLKHKKLKKKIKTMETST